MPQLSRFALIPNLIITVLGKLNKRETGVPRNRICYGSTQVGTLLTTGEALPIQAVDPIDGQVIGTDCQASGESPSRLSCKGTQPELGLGTVSDYTCVPIDQEICSEAWNQPVPFQNDTLCVGSQEVGWLRWDTILPFGSTAATGAGCQCDILEEQILRCGETPYGFHHDLKEVKCIPPAKRCASLDPKVVMQVCAYGEHVGDLWTDGLVVPLGVIQPTEKPGQHCQCSLDYVRKLECSQSPQLQPRLRKSAPVPIEDLTCVGPTSNCPT